MADTKGSSGSLAAAADTGLPRVVVIVRPLPEADDSPTPVSTLVSPDRDTREYDRKEAMAATMKALSEAPAPPIIDPEDQPTERIRLQKRKRTPEDDRLAAAVVQISLDAEPSPLTDFLGRTLLYRAARAAAEAGAPRLVLVGRNLDKADQIQLETEARGGFNGTVEIVDHDLDPKTFGRGRILLLDGSALHEPEPVRRVAQVKGEKTALLLGQYGDGLRVRTEEGLVAEVGREISPYDGHLVGACSVPGDEFEAVTQVGMASALDRLSREELLIGQVATETYARQFRDGTRIESAQRECYEDLADSGNNGVFDDLFGRPVARILTLGLLHQRAITPNILSRVAGLLGLAGAALLAQGHALLAFLAGLFLIVSAILDRTDGELARLRCDDSSRHEDFYLDHMTHALVMLGLAWGVQNPVPGVGGWDQTLNNLAAFGDGLLKNGVSALMVGFVAVAGVLILLGVLLMRGPPKRRATGMRKMGDMLAGSFGSRDYFYALLVVSLMNLAVPGVGIMGLLLLASTIVIHAFWIVLLGLHILTPKRD